MVFLKRAATSFETSEELGFRGLGFRAWEYWKWFLLRVCRQGPPASATAAFFAASGYEYDTFPK